MKYKYAIVCSWGTRDEKGKVNLTEGHAGLLLIETERPMEYVNFPYKMARIRFNNQELAYLKSVVNNRPHKDQRLINREL